MNYSQTIDFLFSRLPMYSRIGAAAYKKDLYNIKKLCTALGEPHTKFKSIHIAGTNGKGSVCHMLAAILQSAGYRTGLHTSPHLRDFRERIKLNGRICEEEFVITFTARIMPLIEEIEPSFFEISVAMAFDYFASTEVEIAVIETGLGGRLDSTNILMPELSVITNIGYDHMYLLGDTLEKIAGEKAGIIKKDVPVVIGEYSAETARVFDRIAAENNAVISYADKKRSVTEWKWEKNALVVEVATSHKEDRQLYHLDLIALYQARNLLTVLEACSALKAQGWNIPDEAIRKGLSVTKSLTGLHGRWEIIHREPLVVLDVGHNEDGFRQLVKQIELTPHTSLHIILGMVRDKEIRKLLGLLPQGAKYYFTRAAIPRALTALELQEQAGPFNLDGEVFPNVNEALRIALSRADRDDLLVVCGSVFLVGEVSLSL